MEIEKLIEILRGKCAVCKRSSCNGKYWELSSCPAMCEAATVLEQLQAENDRLRRERGAAVESWRGFCSQCAWKNHQYLADGKMDDMCRTCRDNAKCNWKWRGPKEE